MKWLALLTAFVAGFLVAALSYKLTFQRWALEYFYLLAAGGAGGTAQALVTGNNRLRLPHWSADGQDVAWDAGFLSDVFIGMLGATVSLLFALALLSDSFFGVVGGQRPDQMVPAWVRVVAFGGLTGFASRQLLPNLSKRLSDLITQQVKDQAEAVGRKIEAQVMPAVDLARSQAEIAQLRAAAPPPRPPPPGRRRGARGRPVRPAQKPGRAEPERQRPRR